MILFTRSDCFGDNFVLTFVCLQTPCSRTGRSVSTKQGGFKMHASTELPKWVFFLGCLLSAVGMTAGMLGIFAPTVFFNDFPEFSQWDDIPYVTTGWGIRNLGMAVAMMIALWLNLPGAIGAVFSMRFFTEFGDLVNTLLTGHGSMDMPLFVLAVLWIALFLIPEALAARWGITTALSSKKK